MLKKDWNQIISEENSVDIPQNSYIGMILKIINEKWDTSMNMYTHNCQHFSMFVLKEYLYLMGRFSV